MVNTKQMIDIEAPMYDTIDNALVSGPFYKYSIKK